MSRRVVSVISGRIDSKGTDGNSGNTEIAPGGGGGARDPRGRYSQRGNA
jgi:hypothetical protein